MATRISGARRAMPPSGARGAMFPSAARLAMPPSAARPSTPAPGRIVRTRASGAGQPEPPTPAATPARASIFAGESLAVWVPVLTGIVSVLTIIMLVRGFISDSSNLLTSQLAANSRELAASNSMLTTKLDASNSMLTTKLDASNSMLTTKLDANTAKLDANTAKLDAITAKLDNFSATVHWRSRLRQQSCKAWSVACRRVVRRCEPLQPDYEQRHVCAVCLLEACHAACSHACWVAYAGVASSQVLNSCT